MCLDTEDCVTLLELFSELQLVLEGDTMTSHEQDIQLLITWRGLTSGTFQRELADWSGLCQLTLSQASSCVG